MRGKGWKKQVRTVGLRITPAYAGKSFQFTHFLFPPWDHPRLCGEKHPIFPPSLIDIGSPPPMRGKVCEHVVTSYSRRITPAYAGKRIRCRCAHAGMRDHPRLCGEKHMEVYAICDIIGSPPPMRGKAGKNQCRWICNRITPAYAGKRHISRPSW